MITVGQPEWRYDRFHKGGRVYAAILHHDEATVAIAKFFRNRNWGIASVVDKRYAFLKKASGTNIDAFKRSVDKLSRRHLECT